MNKTFSNTLCVTSCILSLIHSSVAFADCYDRGDCETIQCWNATEFDKDGDGYAYVGYAYSEHIDDGFSDDFADLGDRETFTIVENDELPGWTDYGLSFFRLVRRKERMTCPTGWVKARGDCDDDDPDTHPRQFEIFGNGKDDNCNGLVDEPSFEYRPTGNNNNRTNFDIGFTINNQDVVNAIDSRFINVKVKIEYQKLKDTEELESQIKDLKSYYSYWSSYKYGEVNLNGLSPNTVYRARVQFVRASYRYVGGVLSVSHENIGDPSGWYYSTTNGRSQLNKARTKILLKGFHQFYESDHHSLIGYLGADTKDGMRYGADEGENWCAEFYGWLLTPFLEGVAHTPWVSHISSYFAARGLEKENPSNSNIKYHMMRGDFVGIATDKSDPNKATHAAMFLAYDKHLDAIWTLDGNTHGFNETPDIDDRRSRRAGNEVSIRVRSLDFEYDKLDDDTAITAPLVKTWGKIRTALMK